MKSPPVEIPCASMTNICAVQSGLREAEDAKHYEAQMAHRGIRDQLLHVRLHHGHKRAINDADQRQRHDPRSIVPRLLGEQPEVKAQQAVCAHLKQNARQQAPIRQSALRRVRPAAMCGTGTVEP